MISEAYNQGLKTASLLDAALIAYRMGRSRPEPQEPEPQEPEIPETHDVAISDDEARAYIEANPERVQAILAALGSVSS